jgi:hypothetical protein
VDFDGDPDADSDRHERRYDRIVKVLLACPSSFATALSPVLVQGFEARAYGRDRGRAAAG